MSFENVFYVFDTRTVCMKKGGCLTFITGKEMRLDQLI